MTQAETLPIEGMSCGHCIAAVKDVLGEIPGVEVLNVEIGSAQVRYAADVVSRAQLVQAVEAEGYTVRDALPAN